MPNKDINFQLVRIVDEQVLFHFLEDIKGPVKVIIILLNFEEWTWINIEIAFIWIYRVHMVLELGLNIESKALLIKVWDHWFWN